MLYEPNIDLIKCQKFSFLYFSICSLSLASSNYLLS